ncbi:hypothetical protein [Bradyrhizobium sp. 613_E4_N2_2]|uniref:hypothetical protein n=1 Tax=Bradyrhizobium sp. 613_E4_N2_2 TaxID=3240371 RepID=UPI003F8BF24F
MTPQYDTNDLLARIAVALERIADSLPTNLSKPPMTTEDFRERLTAAHAGDLISVDQVRAAVDRPEISNRMIGTMMKMAGFERRRLAEGVRYVIGLAKEGLPGRPIEMPPNMDEVIVEARKYPHNMVATVFLSVCMRQAGMKPNVTAAHVAALHARYPGEFTDRVAS